MLPPAAAQETFIREAALHTFLTRASSQPQKAVPPADCSGTKLDCISASSVEATLMCDWDLIYFSPSLGIFTHCCQETIYSDYFKDIVNICCCTRIKQEALVLGTEVKLLLVLAASFAVVLLSPSVLALFVPRLVMFISQALETSFWVLLVSCNGKSFLVSSS